MATVADLSIRWPAFLAEALRCASAPVALESRGTLWRVSGLVLEARGIRARIGTQCQIEPPGGNAILAEVVGFAGEHTYLMPGGEISGLSCGVPVRITPGVPSPPRLSRAGELDMEAHEGGLRTPMGDGLLGRVVDPCGAPLDHLGELNDVSWRPVHRPQVNAMERDPVRSHLDTGVRAINALLTVGRGQRLGLFAGSGVGKSVLLGMMARYTEADVIVVGLIGERGREVKEFVEDILGEEGLRRSVVVAAPADSPPLMRMQGALYATAVAEHFRDRGKHVLLLVDSLTRFVMAQREIALAIGEAPATKGYPPSCFSKLPALVERSGNGLNGVGSITAFYTVLAEADDQQDPVADAARAILDGHVVLSRELAEGGHFPAIDVERSASRVMHNVVDKEHFERARQFRALRARYERSRDLIDLGAYVPGADRLLDQAIALKPVMDAFLQQDMYERTEYEISIRRLGDILSNEGAK